jgi:hypothetical protein
MKQTFSRETISDEKRFVRAEHWIFARQILRARDQAHHRAWRCLILAGPSPGEEISCIKALMPKAYILAADKISENAVAAIDAGADDVVVCDLAGFRQGKFGRTSFKKPPLVLGDDPFDAICLDMTCLAGGGLAEVVKVYARSVGRGGPLTKNGAFIVNFSYGRDVLEYYSERWRQAKWDEEKLKQRLSDSGMPEQIAQRIFCVLGRRVGRLRSVLQYSGNAMPMLSCFLVVGGSHEQPSVQYESILPTDFEAAVTAEDIGNIYACPKERIAALRRSQAARKAVQTRKVRQAALPQEPDLLRCAPQR